MVLSRQPVPQSQAGGHMAELSEITALRQMEIVF